jgi:hypothetical protein
VPLFECKRYFCKGININNIEYMSSITELWTKSPDTFEKKKLSQILMFAGDGKLKDGNITSLEFRDLLDQVPSAFLKKFAESCLTDKFDDSGFALQDTINQIGKRLGFQIEHGLYRGNQNDIGFDGIWKSKDEHNLVLEVKTTDAYRINLDTIATYRTELIEGNRINKNQSSILIVVGRQDTGDLEAQIRGSQHAWDIRLISTDSLINLLSLKESLNDTRTIQQINELLKPREYTRIDKLIELIFETSKDLQLDELEETEIEATDEPKKKQKRKSSEERTTPVNFHDGCLKKIQIYLGITLIKQSRISYTNKENTIGLICAISKPHKQGQHEKYWFAFHPHQQEFLEEHDNSFVSFGCGNPDKTFLIPFKDFQPFVKNMWTTQNDDRMYWHVVIHDREGKYLLAQPENNKHDTVDITKYKI